MSSDMFPCPPALPAQRGQAAPLDLFAQEEEPPEYVRVEVEGVFDHGASQYVGPRTRQVAGTSKQVCTALPCCR